MSSTLLAPEDIEVSGDGTGVVVASVCKDVGSIPEDASLLLCVVVCASKSDFVVV